MFGLIRRFLIGGNTGGRELALLVLFVVLGFAAFAIWQESRGNLMPASFSFLTIAFPTAIAGAGGAFGIKSWRGQAEPPQ